MVILLFAQLSGQLYFRRSNFLHSKHFLRVTTSTQLLHFRSSYLFRAATFSQNNNFFIIATFSEQNFHRAANSWEQVVFQGSYFLNTATFSAEELAQNKNIYRRGTFSRQLLLHRKKLFYFFWRATFSEWLHFQNLHFHNSYCFQHALFHSYTSSPQHFLFINQFGD